MWGWLSGGLILGWSVGANVGANIFATAVASRMVRFHTAIIIGAAFVLLGGLVNGPAALDTLAGFGAIDTLAGGFSAAFASALAMVVMTAIGLPASAAQTVVGALIGHQLFRQGNISESAQLLLSKIITTWLCAPLLAAAVAFIIYKGLDRLFQRIPMPLFLVDQWLRIGLIAAGCYSAWAFGGNNIAIVAGFYSQLAIFAPWQVGPWVIYEPQILALLGGLAIAIGMATYSHRIMLKIGHDLVRLDATSAFVAIVAEALVVDFFAHRWQFAGFILPAIPVSISQALIGGILGLGLARGVQTVRLGVLFHIVAGWIMAPVIACALTYMIEPLMISFG